MMKQNNWIIHKIFNLSIETTFLVASLPFIGYLMAYWYQFGFYRYLDVPTMLIKVGIEDVIRVVTPVMALVIFVIFLLVLFRLGAPPKPPQKPQKLTYYPTVFVVALVCVFLITFIVYSLQQTLVIKIVMSVILVLIFILVALLPRFYFPDAKTFALAISSYNKIIKEKNEKSQGEDSTTENNKKLFPFELIPESKTHSYGVYFFAIIVLCLVSLILGWDHASSKDMFLIHTDDLMNEYIIIGPYNDNMVSVMIDKERKTASQIKLLSVSDGVNLSYKYTGLINAYKKAEKTTTQPSNMSPSPQTPQ
jgi:hypothetical protein